jgi:hypothetical protein
VEFRLVYRGPLPSQSAADSRTREKIAMRRCFHEQMAELWKQRSALRKIPPREVDPETGETIKVEYGGLVIHKKTSKSGHVYNLLPLIGERFGVSCSLDVLFLRREGPGGLVKWGGDIDNRIKVLFDALRMPQDDTEIPDVPPAPDEDPFFCVLEDDKFIDRLNVTTDRLLTRLDSRIGEKTNDVQLVIHVCTLVFDPFRGHVGFVD